MNRPDRDTSALVELPEGHSLVYRVTRLASRHPLWTVALVALALRVAAVIVLGPLRPGVAVPDEAQYLGLAASVAGGHGAEAWQPGYGAMLYNSTSFFMVPLSALTWLFGVHQLCGQVLAATFGVVTAALTAALALRVVRPPVALLAGVLVAALPSQVYWSSVVLRESMVWAALALLALAVSAATTTVTRGRLLLIGGVALLGLFALCHLRQQTALVAAWSLPLAAVVARSQRRLLVPLGALLLAVLVPLLGGLGPAGYSIVEESVPRLGVIRANLSLGASSSIVHTTPISPTPSSSGAVSPGPDSAPTSTKPVVTSANGQQFRVDADSPGASLSALPSGLVAVTLRPFLWEPAHNSGVMMAKMENAVWLPLYLLAGFGAVLGWRRRNVLAFPVIVTGAILLTAAVTQGNLGTAFRHRGQTLWALALLAAVSAQGLIDRRRTTHS